MKVCHFMRRSLAVTLLGFASLTFTAVAEPLEVQGLSVYEPPKKSVGRLSSFGDYETLPSPWVPDNSFNDPTNGGRYVTPREEFMMMRKIVRTEKSTQSGSALNRAVRGATQPNGRSFKRRVEIFR